jgi:hypothetical protein
MGQKRGSQGIKVGIEDIIKSLIIIYIHIKVQKSLCQIEYLQTKSLFKKICF